MKQCSKCGLSKEIGEFYKKSGRTGVESWCKLCRKAMSDDHYLKNSIHRRDIAREYDRLMKLEMITAYGGKCTGYNGYNCNEVRPDALQIDHVNNDGYLDKFKSIRGGRPLYYKLKREGWPKDKYQLLCASCNFVKRAQFARLNTINMKLGVTQCP